MIPNKRAISAVIATVLIILITVAGVTIITAIIPMIKDNLKFSEVEGRVKIIREFERADN